MFFRHKKNGLLMLACCAMGSSPVTGDDTDIYLNPNNPNAAPPLVMLTFDYSPSLGSTLCTDYRDASCETLMGPVIYPMLVDNIEGPGMLYRDTDSDGMLDDPVVEPFDMVRAVLRTIIMSDEMNGLALGISLPHDDTCNGGTTAGPSALPAPNHSGCSNGGYILSGFELFSAADFNSGALVAGSARDDFLQRLGKVPSPHGNVSHKYQMRELYFEFFRYLTGGDVYNGHLGYDDFASTDDEKNLNDTTNTYKTDTSSPVLTDTTTFSWDDSIETGTVSAATYTSPYVALSGQDWSCAKTFMVNTYFSDVQQSDSDSAIAAAVASGGTGVSMSGSDQTNTSAIVEFMYQNDMADGTIGPNIDGIQNVQSYFITSKNNNNAADEYAFKGGTGRAFKLNEPEQLLEDLRSIFREILSVSTTIVAASVPVNVFNRTEVVDNVYFALFKAESTPSWNGNVKKLKIVEKNTGTETYYEIVSVENTGISAFSTDGRIRTDALTHWSKSDGYDVVATSQPEDVSGRDGRSVNRGGAGQQIPGYLDPNDPTASGDPGLANGAGTRQLYTVDSAGNGLMALNANSTLAAELQNRLSAADTTEAETLLKWLRGYDVDDLDGDSTTTDPRPWLMGDPIHSRPIAVNYGDTGTSYTQDNPNLRIFFGDNDGFFRALKDASSGTQATGKELFSFMPRELMKNTKTLRANNAADAHPYGVDGAPVALVIDLDGDGNIETVDGDKVYIYFGLRRGGRSYFALDVSDPSDSVTPSLLWKIRKPISFSSTNGSIGANTSVLQAGETLTPGMFEGGKLIITTAPHNDEPYYNVVANDDGTITVADDTDSGGNPVPEFINAASNVSYSVTTEGEADFTEMGLSFSIPKITTVKYDSDITPVLIFGGGYDPDKDNGASADDDEGNAIYIVNALTGALIWKAVQGSSVNTNTVHYVADMVDAIPAPVSIVDSNGNGITDRLYVGDTGGAIWRVDLPEGDESAGAGFSRASKWFVTKLAELGTDGGADDRRFFHATDTVNTKDNQGEYTAIIASSGDRANPRDTAVDNFLFVIKDRQLVSGATAVQTRTPLVVNDLVDITDLCITGVEVACTGANLVNGWRLALEANGEKGLSTPITAGGTIFFTSYLPEGGLGAGNCAPSEGAGLIYAVRLSSGTVDTNVFGVTDPTKSDRYVDAGYGIPPGVTPLGSGNLLLPGKGVGGRQIIETSAKTRWKIYWRETGVDNL